MAGEASIKAHVLEKIQDRSAVIGVIGLGYVGLPLAVEFAKAGFHVIGFDVSDRLCKLLMRGESHIQDVPASEVAALADVADVTTPYIDPSNESIFNQYTIRVQKRDALQAHLKNAGIGTAVYYPLPLHLQPCFAYLGYKAGSCPEAERAANEVLSLPIFPELTRDQLDEVVGAVRKFYGR